MHVKCLLLRPLSGRVLELIGRKSLSMEVFLKMWERDGTYLVPGYCAWHQLITTCFQI